MDTVDWCPVGVNDMAAKKETTEKEKDPTLAIVKGLNDSPIFKRIAAASDYERVGLQLHRKGKIEGEYTNHIKDGKLVSVKEGLHNPDFVIRIDLDMWDKATSGEGTKWMQEHPIQAIRKYWKHIEMPFMVKMKLGAKLLTG